MAQPELEGILNKFHSFTEKPVKFLTVQSEVKDDVKNLVKSIYDYTKEQEGDAKKGDKGALPQLIVEDMDEEQIWQELELQNNECWDNIVWEVANCISMKNDLLFPVKTENELSKEKKDSSVEFTKEKKSKKPEKLTTSDEEGSDDQDSEEIDNPVTKKPQKVKTKVKPSIVDDKFFKLQEMEEFLLKEERNEGKTAAKDSDDESIDLFEDFDDESDEEGEGNNVMYNDFFDQDNKDNDSNENYDETLENGKNFFENDEAAGDADDVEMDDIEDETEDQPASKKDKKVRFAQPSSSDDDDELEEETPTANVPNEKRSEFEQRQERLKQTIERLEQKTLKEAPWQLKGEVNALKRPQNSLLQEVVDFDLTTRPAPIITEQTTITLEDIIRQRIKDKAWDDVIRKEKPVDDQLNFRKTEVLDQSKSKLSLAQVYEAEYLKQKQASSGETTEEKEPEAHTEIRKSMTQLFAKLDALCHYHYTPKAVQPEVKIVTNTPAISMEEVAPIATSDAVLLAPEEVKKKHRGDLMSKEERTDTDKKRERRKKKKQQKAKGHIPKVTDNRNTKQGIEANDKSFKTSKAFFQQLNDDTTSLIKSKKNKVKSK